MTFSRRKILLTAVGLMAIAAAGLNMVYSQKLSELNKLDGQLALTQAKLKTLQLNQLSSQKADLEQKLSQTNTQLESARAILSRPIGNFTITNMIFDLAGADNLEVTKMTLFRQQNIILEGVPCSLMSFETVVEGDVSDLVRFVADLNSSFATVTVNSIAITVPEVTSDKKPSADIELAVYTRQER